MERADDTVSEVDEAVELSPSGDDTAQTWYWVKATYKAVHVGIPRKRHLWERVVFLVHGPGGLDITLLSPEDRAYLWEKAEKVACEKEHEYLGGSGRTIRWVLQEIERIGTVGDSNFRDGIEVYWELFRRVDKNLSESWPSNC